MRPVYQSFPGLTPDRFTWIWKTTLSESWQYLHGFGKWS